MNFLEMSKIKTKENDCLFSSYGVEFLDSGKSVVLSDASYIKRYKGNYCIELIKNKSTNVKYEDWITPILQYNRENESFVLRDVNYQGNNPYVWEYLRICRKTKIINRFVKN